MIFESSEGLGEKGEWGKHSPLGSAGVVSPSADVFRELGLLSASGKPRLNVAQGYFKNLEGTELLESLYVFWRDFDEYLVLRSLRVNPKTFSSEWDYIAVKCSKRGNDVYQLRVKKRLDWLSKGDYKLLDVHELKMKKKAEKWLKQKKEIENGEKKFKTKKELRKWLKTENKVKKWLSKENSPQNIKFFDVKDFKTKKKVYSQALWITLTYDTKRSSKTEAWLNIGVEWNRFISALRRRYGKISVLRTWESSEKGYPHVHAVLLFHEAKFEVFPFLSVEEGKFSFRIKNKNEIASYWHSFVDVQAISSTKKLFNYMRKYQTKTLLNSDSPKGVLTMALMWLFRKQGFSVSGDFKKRLHDLIMVLHNSNMVLVQSFLFGGHEDVPIWEFVGVFSGRELGINSKTWSVRLKPEQIKIVLAKEFESSTYGDVGEWD